MRGDGGGRGCDLAAPCPSIRHLKRLALKGVNYLIKRYLYRIIALLYHTIKWTKACKEGYESKNPNSNSIANC